MTSISTGGGTLRRFVQCAVWCALGTLVCLGGRPAFAATYTWNVTSGLWTDNLSWAPTTSAAGTGPVAADTIVYAGAASQTINLGGATQTASILTTNPLSATSLTLTATNGSLVLSGNAQQNFYATSASSGSLTYDFSGLSGFSYNAPTRTFNIGWDVGTATGTTTFNFATQGSGTNTITAQTFQTAGPNNTNVLGLSVINLGKVNTINSSTFSIGGYSNSGTVAFGSGVTNGSLVLRGTAGGTARVDNIYVGQSAAGAGSNRSGSGWLNLAGGSLDARATTTTVGGAIVNNQSIASTGVLTLASGTLDTLTLVVGSKSNVGSPALTATINQNGGLVLSGTVRFGDIPTAGSAAPTFTSTYNLTSGTLSAAVITTQPSLAITATTTANAASIRRIAWSGGTITHYDASTDLTISGTSTNAGYTMQIVLGGAGTTETFSADTGRTITVDTGAVISGTGNLVKAGAGTLTLTGSSTYAGDTLVSAGTLALGANLSLQNSVLDTSGAGSVVLNAGVTAPTLGGLKGATNLATEIASGYASVTGVTLNVGSGTSVTYSGAIADGAAGMTLTKTGTSTQVLSGANTYTGVTTINSGTLSVTTLANGNAASGIGQSSNAAANLVLGGGVLVLENSSLASSTDRLFTLTGNGLIYNNNATAANTLAFTSSGTIAQSGAGTRQMNLGGSNTGTNTFAPVLTDNGVSPVSFRKQNAGLWSITGTANTYTGATTLAGGTLMVAKLANGGSASSIGASGSAAANLVFNGGSLVYVGGGDTTDRAFTITSAPTINASGSGALTWNGSAPTFSSGNTAYAITLRGTSTAANTFGTPLADNGSGAISVSKLDAGLWVLSGSNTYTGATTVSAGTLRVGSTNALGAATASLAVNAGTLDLNGTSVTVGLLSGSSGATITTNTTGSITLTAGAATSGTFSGTIASGSGTLAFVKAGSGALTLTASNSYAGGTTLSSGTVVVGNANALGATSGSLAVNAGTLDLNGNSITVGALSGSSGATITSNTTGSVTLTAGAANASTFAGTIANGSGTLAFVKAGSGALTLTASNSYAGGTTLSSGTLVVGSANALGATSGALATNAGTLDLNGNSITVGLLTGSSGATITSNTTGSVTLTANSASSGTYAGTITSGSGTVGLTKSGAGTLTLSAANTFTGDTLVSAGTLSLGSNLALQNSVLDTSGGGFLALGVGVATPTIGGLKGSTNLATEIASGYGSVTGLTLNVAAGASATYAGVIANGAAGMTLTKTGPGTQILSNANTYTGQTTISSGTLQLSGGNNRLTTAGTMLMNGNGGLDLGGNSQTLANFTATTNVTAGAITAVVGNGSLTANGAGDFSITNTTTTTGMLTVNMSGLASLTINKNANLLVQGATYNTADQDQVLVLSATSNAVAVNTVSVGSQAAGSGNVAAGVLQLGATNTLYADNFNIGKTARASGLIEFQSGLPGTPSVTIRNKAGTGRANVYLSENWGGFPSASTGALDFSRGTVDALFGTVEVGRQSSNAVTGLGIITMGTSGGTIDATSMTLGFGLTTGSGFATGTFTQNGSASTVKIDSLVMGNNTSSSAVTLNATYNLIDGTLFARSIASGTDTGGFAAGSSRKIDWTAGTIRNYDASTDLAIDGRAGTGGGLTINLLTTAAHTFQADTGRTITLGTAATVAGAGALTKAGAGSLVMNGSNTFSGGVNLNAGTLTLGNAGAIGSSGTISFGGGTLQYSASNTTDYSSRFSTAAGQQYRIDTNGASVALGNALTSSGGSLVKLGSGTLTLGGANSYDAGTTVSAGVLVGTAASLQGPITNNAAVEFALTANGTYSGAMNGSGSLTKSGVGVLTLAGANTYGGGTIVSAGRLVGTTTSLQGAITNNAVVEFALPLDGTYSGAMGGSGSLMKSGAGVLTLAGVNSYGGGTVVSAGRLVGTTTSLQGAITNNAAVEFALTSDGTYSGVMGGSGSLTKTGAGVLTLTGANNYGGGTVVSAGRLVGTTTSLQGVITNNAAVEFALPTNGTYSGVMGGSGSLTKTGAGVLTLAAANTYGGSTLIDAGTLKLGSAGSIASSPLVKVASGAIYDVASVANYALASNQTLGGVGTVLGDLIVAGGATLSPGNSPGTLLQTGSQTWGAGGNYNWQLYDSGSAAIPGTGWDFLNVIGALSITASGSNPFNVNLWTLSSINPDANGFANNFDGMADYAWDFATFSGGISGFDATAFAVVTSAANGTGGFLNDDATGSFSVRLKPGDSNTLQIVYAAVPEPSGIALAGVGTGLAAWLVRRRRPRKAG